MNVGYLSWGESDSTDKQLLGKASIDDKTMLVFRI